MNTLKMEKLKTINNFLCREIIRCAVSGCSRAVYMYLYNNHEIFTYDLFVRIYNLCFEFCPLTLEVYKTLPYDVQSWYDQLWLSSISNDNNKK